MSRVASVMASVFSCTLFLAVQRGYADTTVTYITKVQEERRSTRWTLTEWLRIKERMRMMDVWLAMFSEPKKEKFTPELSLSYSQLTATGQAGREDAKGETESKGQQGQVRLWLTNLVSASTGIRTLNIDLGVEYFHQQYQLGQSGDATASQAAEEGNAAYGLNLRIFGKNIQDSSLVLKYGEYRREGPVAWQPVTGFGEAQLFLGKYVGAELHLYLFGWLGLSGQGYQFRKVSRSNLSGQGYYYEYGPYIEISLLRLYGGRFSQMWAFSDETLTESEAVEGASTLERNGTFVGVILNI